MKKFISIVSLAALVIPTLVDATQSSNSRARKPATSAAKPMTRKNDAELLQDQIAQRSRDQRLMNKLNKDKELKRYIDTHVCPMKNWTAEDRLDTVKWLRGAYNAMLTNWNKKYKSMNNIDDLLYELLYNGFTNSPYYLSLTPRMKDNLTEPTDYMERFVEYKEGKLVTPLSFKEYSDKYD